MSSREIHDSKHRFVHTIAAELFALMLAGLAYPLLVIFGAHPLLNFYPLIALGFFLSTTRYCRHHEPARFRWRTLAALNVLLGALLGWIFWMHDFEMRWM